jgi:hypothetical protein
MVKVKNHILKEKINFKILYYNKKILKAKNGNKIKRFEFITVCELYCNV